jgi:hypothetical protein
MGMFEFTTNPLALVNGCFTQCLHFHGATVKLHML